MHVTWMKRLLWSDHDWAVLIREKLPPMEEFLTYGSKKLVQYKDDVANRFWKNVLSSWIEFILLYKPDISDVLS